MTKRDTCPSPNVWRKVVADGFADLSVDDLGEHLDGCPVCQAAVESLMPRPKSPGWPSRRFCARSCRRLRRFASGSWKSSARATRPRRNRRATVTT